MLSPFQRHIVRENPRLANLTESDEDQEPLRPPKRLRDGTAKQGKAADGNDFFSVLEDCLVQMRREKGDDWKDVEWTMCVLILYKHSLAPTLCLDSLTRSLRANGLYGLWTAYP